MARQLRALIDPATVALITLLISPHAVLAHGQEPAWLNEAVLDGGLHIDVQYPRVIRRTGPVDVRVTLRNIAGANHVTVETIQFEISGESSRDTHRFDRELPTHRAVFLQYQAAAAEAGEQLQRGDVAAVPRNAALRHRLLHQLAEDALIDSIQVPAATVAGHAGATLEIVLDITIADDGRRRAIRRAIAIPVRSPLPTGHVDARRYRYDVRTHSLRVDDRAAPVRNRSEAVAWYAGDQHLHTTYSLDAFVLDGTVENVTDYAATAELVGLDWIIVTDHSNVHVNWSGTDYYTPVQYAEGAAQAAAYSAQNPLLALYGQEMGAGQTGLFALPSHYLAYPFGSDSTGYLANPSSGLLFGLANCEPEQVIIDRVNDAGGFGFIAHPFDSGSLAFAEWDFGNGATGWSGLEIWSDATGQIKSTDDQAVSQWHMLLNAISPPQLGRLDDRPGFPNAFPVGLGNSDAHQPGLIGATFTYAWMPGVTRSAVVSALRNGRCVASNGPLLRGQINGARIGEVALLLDGDNDLELTLNTTPEFGPVGDYTINVYVNGAVRATVPATGDPGFAMVVELTGVDLSVPDKFVTLRADSLDGVHHAITNPVWLQFTAIGDGNADGLVTPTDLITFTYCMRGSGIPRVSSCDIMDFDRDRDVDLADFAEFQLAFTRP